MIRHKTLLRIINRSQNWHRCVQTDNLNIEKLEQESSQIDGEHNTLSHTKLYTL